MQHGEHVVQRQQWAKHKRIWQAEAAAQFCDHQQHVPSDTPGSPGVGDEAADEGPAVNMVQLTLPPGPDAAQAYSAIRSTLPLGHPSLVQEAAYVKDADGGWTWGMHPGFTPEQQRQLEEVVRSRKHVFAYSMADLPGYSGDVEPMRIPFKPEFEGKPIFEAPRRHSELELEVQDKKFTELKDVGFVVPAKGTRYASNCTMPAKKDPATGEWTDIRVCYDLRRINDATEPDKHALPLPEDIFRSMAGSRFWTVIDLRSGFFQMHVAEEDQPKTGHWWRGSLWQLTRVPFGAKNSPPYFTRVVEYEISKAGLGHCCKSFVDDLAVHSVSAEEHIRHVSQVLDMLYGCGLRAHPEKSVFGAQVVSYLGHAVSEVGLTPQEAKVQAIKEMRPPVNKDEVRAVLGFLGYYRCYCPGFSSLAQPLNALLAGGAVWQWGPEQQHAFEALKGELCTEGKVLRHLDPGRPLLLHTDWSKQGIGAVLGQKDDEGQEYMVACVSRSLNKHERNYASYEGEMLAVVWAVKTLRPMLHGRRFTVITDHRPLLWLMRTRDLTGKYARWALSLQEYDFEVQYREGAKHQNADGLSRLPLESSEDVTGARLDDEGPAVFFASLGEAPKGRAAVLAGLPVQQSPQSALLHACMVQAAEADPVELASLPEHLLSGHLGVLSAAECTTACSVHADLGVAGEQRSLALQAAAWVSAAQAAGAAVPPSSPAPAGLTQQLSGAPDAFGVRATSRLCTALVPPAFYAAALSEGIVLYEPFGGLCAGLEMVLRNGFVVSRYLYSDVDPAARAVAASRVRWLAARYPGQIRPSALVDMFTALPQDVKRVTTEALVQAGAKDGWWLVVAGWECQDLSPAGKGRGLQGSRSITFYDLLRMVGALQQLNAAKPPAFVIENTAVQHNFSNPGMAAHDWPLIVEALGEPLLFDAVQVGSFAHRLRNYWTNLAAPAHLVALFEHVPPPASAQQLTGYVIQDAGRVLQYVERPDPWPQYAVNVVGQPRKALPTLVAYPGSRAFRPGCAGAVWLVAEQRHVEPSPDERERALGYNTGATRAPGVSEQSRHAVTGRCMDAFAMQALMACCIALRHAAGDMSGALGACTVLAPDAPALPAPPMCLTPSSASVQTSIRTGWAETQLQRRGWRPGQGLGLHRQGLATPLVPTGRSVAAWQRPGLGRPEAPRLAAATALPYQSVVPEVPELPVVAVCTTPHVSSPRVPEQLWDTVLLAAVADAEDGVSASAPLDVWADAPVLQHLQGQQLGPGLSRSECRRILRRARGYRWADGQLFKVMADGSTRQVPEPAGRLELVRRMHTETGHFGEKRTLSLLGNSHWWRGMLADVRHVVQQCKACDLARSNFNAALPSLQPLPVMGLFYRWSVDLTGPFPTSRSGMRYVMVMIEHYSKFVELAAIPAKEAVHTAAAFRSRVLCRYGAMAEVVTDQGTEFLGEFHALLEQALVDHRVISADRPSSNGLAERAVQAVKQALRRRCHDTKVGDQWDSDIPWIMLGYNCSEQAASGFKPYQLMHAQLPTVPPAVVQRVDVPLDFDIPADELGKQLLQRAQRLQRDCVMAGENLLIAQHRDTLRYAAVRSGMFKPRERKFAVGDFVYQRLQGAEALHMRARPAIYRIKQVKPSGVAVLQGRCGRTLETHLAHIAPCHLANIDPTVDVTLQRPEGDLACEVCRHVHDDADMLLCDECGTGWHNYCMVPEVIGVPEGIWLCPRCEAAGVTAEAVQRRVAQGPAPEEGPEMVDTGTRERRRAAAVAKQARQAQELDGRIMQRTFYSSAARRRRAYKGRLRYLGPGHHPPLEVAYEDGDVQPISVWMAKKHLLPGGETMPAPEVHSVQAVGLAGLPPQWELAQSGQLLAALQQLMPGEWDSRAVARVANQIAEVQQLAAQGRHLPLAPTQQEEVDFLLRRVLLQNCSHVLEPFNGLGAISRALRAAGCRRVTTNDLCAAYEADLHLDALQPATYAELERLTAAPVDAVVTSPWFPVLDIVLPLLERCARSVVCVHVPGHYIASGVGPRYAYLQQLQRQGRLVVLFGVPRGVLGWRCAWLLIFKSPALKRALLTPGVRTQEGLVLE